MMNDFNKFAKDCERRMKNAVEMLRRDLGGLRSGPAAVSFLEPVRVEAYGSVIPLNQCGNISVLEPRMLSVQVWDKSLIRAVEKAIRDSGLGLNPTVDGQLIRVPIPVLTEERRTEFKKIAGKYAEESRIAVRNVRRHAMDELKRMEKDGDVSEDKRRSHNKDIQALTDKYVSEIDEALQRKEQEIMQV